MYRNTLSIIIGLLISIFEMIFFIFKGKKFFIEIKFIPIKNINLIFSNCSNKFLFIIIIFYTISIFSGSIITSMLVKKAKEAYGILIRYILITISIFFIIFYPFPLWFKITSFPIFLILYNIIGLINQLLINKRNQKYIQKKQSN